MANFNLLIDSWIPCLKSNGRVAWIGAREALTQAGTIRQIAASNPMDRLAILRFLLALLYWCKGNPPENKGVASTSAFSEEWFTTLDKHREWFNLLGDGRRFYQYRKYGDKAKTINYLIHEVPSGTNFNHFRHAEDGSDGLCPACCAMGLVRLPVFTTSGGSGLHPSINAKLAPENRKRPPIYAVPLGETLAATLRLSWRTAARLGTPAWEKPNITLPTSGEVPLLTGLTWLPRRVWLSDPEGDEANCIACGRSGRLIQETVFAGMGVKVVTPIWQDPHVLYEPDGTGTRPVLTESALASPARRAGQWASVLARVLERNDDLDSGEGRRYWVVGFATVQNDKYLEATEEVRVLPRDSPSSDAVQPALQRWEREQAKLARRFGSSGPKVRARRKSPTEVAETVGRATLAAIRPGVKSTVAGMAADLLAGGEEAWRDAAGEYRPLMTAVARSLAPGFTVAAAQQRRRIADTVPDMTPTPDKAKASGGRKSRKGGAR